MNTYLVATTKPWNIEAFNHYSPKLKGNWHLVTEAEALTAKYVKRLAPRYIFFPHWSSLVGSDILNLAECVCFHASDVPFGRGGSPVQNLIIRGFAETNLSALRMVEELDAGPVYTKRPLSLQGRGQDIFERMAEVIWSIIESMISEDITPVPQTGSKVFFKRRTAEQSELPMVADVTDLYNHIRMLDAETYPTAFINYGDFKLEFTTAELQDSKVEAKVTIHKRISK
ncbi:hypothetical protein [Methylophaga sp.]|uniref:hypothetical protein n=1 Tax=Methylophaga sp. TaxID=2024840 RepID=UPI003A95824E